MRLNSRRGCAALLLAVAVLAGCTSEHETPGSAAKDGGTSPGTTKSGAPSPGTSGKPSATPSPRPERTGVGPYRPGDCVELKDGVTKVNCDRPHEYEVTKSASFPSSVSDNYPPPVKKYARPRCDAAVPGYLGSPDWEASRLDTVAFWPTEKQWKNGDRWFACLLGERSPKDEPVRRKGSLYAGLAHGLAGLQACMKGEPEPGGPNSVIPCDEPHRTEAVPGVVDHGDPAGPAPSVDEMLQQTKDRCPEAVKKYLGGDKPGVTPHWLSPRPDQWSSEYHTSICYAVSKKAHTGTLASR
ncbi:septum formation family protein [Streptomyces sp. NPDC058221]|uniref:septum formation family protein n=1 Tax=Streptomyces sp. NPDC058221 TaxID=3346388 RepID=UPI0036EBE698